MTDLTKLSIKQALTSLKNKEFSSVELTESYIKNIEKNRHLNAFITESFDVARAAAAVSDARIAKGEMRELEGIPLGIKDLFCTKNIRTTSGSKMLENFVPTYESTVTQQLLNAGSVTLGKLNMDEFAMGSSNANSYFGPVINPYKKNGASTNYHEY